MPVLGAIGAGSSAGFGFSESNGSASIFNLLAQNSIVPIRAKGSYTPTFTRATVATVVDFEGRLVTVPSGAARFQGARFVRNRVATSDDISGGIVAGGVDDVVTATRYTLGTQSATHYTYFTISGLIASSPLLLRVKVKQGTAQYAQVSNGWGGSKYNGITVNLATGAVVSTTATAGTTLVSYGVSAATDADGYWTVFVASSVATLDTTAYASLGIATSSAAFVIGTTAFTGTGYVDFKNFQITDATGQSNVNMPEYVSRGVLSAPYHGAGIDGVKYFTTQNGNTVASNVVTEATGAAISSANSKYGVFPNGATSYIYTGNATANQITGDIDIRALIAPTDWTPAAVNCIVTKTDFGANRGYEFVLNAAGTLNFVQSGVANLTSTAATGFTDRTAHWVRVTRSSSTGDTKFYTSEDGVTWTQLGTTVAGATGSIANVAVNLVVGGSGNNSLPFDGRIYAAQIYNGIAGTLAVNFNANDFSSGTTWTASTTGETWTINGSAKVFGGSGTSSIAAPWDANGPQGYLSEGAGTNLCPQSNTLATTWAQTVMAAPSQNAVGIDGATSAWTLTDASASLGYQTVAFTSNLTAANYTASIFVKKTTGAQSSYPVLDVESGALCARCTIDTSNGVATVWTAATGSTVQTSTATCVSFNADYWRVSLTWLATVAAWQVYLVPAGTANATQSTGSLDATAQGSAVMTCVQCELGSFATSYIATTTIAVARNADVLTFVSAGNISGTVGTVYMEFAANNWTSLVSTGDVYWLASLNGGGAIPMGGRAAGSNTLGFYDGTYRLGNAYTASSTPLKQATQWGGTTGLSSLSGTNSASLTFDGDMNLAATFSIGANFDGGASCYGTIRNIRIYNRALSAAQLAAMTT